MSVEAISFHSSYFGNSDPVTLFGLATPALAQSTASTGTLRGQVTDPSGAVVPNTTVAFCLRADRRVPPPPASTGNYEIGNLAPGKYTVTANAQGFAVFVQNDVDVAAGEVKQFNIALDINVQQEKVNVESGGHSS